MDKQRRQLIDFVERAQGLDNAARLKLILFAAGAKPATFIALKICHSNLDEKAHLERHLKAIRALFIAGRPRAYEEITGIRGNRIKWEIRGSWYGYDIFADRKRLVQFNRYKSLLGQQKHAEADRIAGKLYGYPECCIRKFIINHLQKKSSDYQTERRTQQAFPLVQHSPCSPECSRSRKLNAAYAAALKKHAPKFWKQFSGAKKYSTDIVVNAVQAPAAKGWRAYSLVTLGKIIGHHWMLSHITRKKLKRGTVLAARITTQYNGAVAALGKPKRIINNLHHERRFVVK